MSASSGQAAVTTSFAGGVLTITGDGADDTISLTRTPAGEFRLNGAAITDMPTVVNTDSIQISAGGGSDMVLIDLKNGSFAPGLTAEATGVSEIEVTASGGGGHDLFWLRGRPSADRIDLGVNGLNLNGDGDVDATPGAFETFSILGFDGNDVIDARGNPVVGGGFTFRILVDGGDGDDLLAAGLAQSNLNGRAGRDRFVGNDFRDTMGGGGEGDTFTGGGGNDLFAGGSGNDLVVEQVNGNVTLTDGRLVGNGTDGLKSIQGARLTGGAGSDTFDATKYRHPVTLIGLGGADVLKGGRRPDDVSGGRGDDKLFGLDGRDRLDGGPGTDRGNGGPAIDTCISIEVPVACE